MVTLVIVDEARLTFTMDGLLINSRRDLKRTMSSSVMAMQKGVWNYPHVTELC